MKRNGKNKSIRRYQNSGDVFYAVNFQFEGVRVRKRGFSTIKEARSYVDRIRFLIVTDQYAEYEAEQEAEKKDRRQVTLGECLNLWFDAETDLRDSSKQSYRYLLTREILKTRMAQVKIGKVDSPMMQRLDASLIEQGRGTGYTNNVMAALLKVLRFAAKRGLILEAPTHTGWHRQRVRKTFLSYKEIMKLVRSARKLPNKSRWVDVYIMTQFYTFSRAGEVLALEWADVDFENKRINISKRVHRGAVANTTKNNRVDSYFPLHDNLIPYLKRQQALVGHQRLVFPPCFFYSTDPRAASKRKKAFGYTNVVTVNYILARLARIAGIDPKRISTHVLRKSGGDILLRSGATIHQVAAALRCTTANVLKSYSQLDREAFDCRIFAFSPNENDNEASTGSQPDAK